MIDLHVHSNRSDGTFTPTELVDYAIKKGLSAFALTDHDTVDGLEEAIAYAEKLRVDADNLVPSSCRFSGDCGGPVLPIPSSTIPQIIPGIEFSTEYQGRDIHIVGLDIDYKNPEFTAYLKNFVDSRILRNQKMCTRLQEAGIDITYEKLLAEFPDAVITRAHYAAYLMHHGYTKSLPESFDRYVGDHCPYFVPREKVTPAQAVELILKAGGIPVLAHPVLYRMSDERLDKLVAELKAAGLVALEAVYSTYNAGEERRMRSLAAKYDLLISGGSDFHGANKPDIDLGVGKGKLYIHDSVWEDLRHCPKKNTIQQKDQQYRQD